jgi:hypothetical protein
MEEYRRELESGRNNMLTDWKMDGSTTFISGCGSFNFVALGYVDGGM